MGTSQYAAEYHRKYPYRRSAITKVRYQLALGVIIKSDRCFICDDRQSKRLVMHHENYALPLDIVWLCDFCHKKRHMYLKSVGWVDYIEPMSEKLPKNDIQPDTDYDLLENIFSRIGSSYREEEIMKLRAKGLLLGEIGTHYNVSGERIRQILVSAYRKYQRWENRAKQTA